MKVRLAKKLAHTLLDRLALRWVGHLCCVDRQFGEYCFCAVAAKYGIGHGNTWLEVR